MNEDLRTEFLVGTLLAFLFIGSSVFIRVIIGRLLSPMPDYVFKSLPIQLGMVVAMKGI